MSSEVARLREEIEQGYRALRLGFSGYAITARHSIITHRYDALGEKVEQLGRLIGEEEANKVAGALYVATMGEEPGLEREEPVFSVTL